MEKALGVGADMLNDISALEDDGALSDFIAETRIPVILMHKRGVPVDMQERTAYIDVAGEVEAYLRERIAYALGRGIGREKIILDPGIGFGKGAPENAALIMKGGALCGGEFPVLVGLSRKACIGQMSGEKKMENRLAGTVAANMLAVRQGAALVRVHDIRETVDALRVMSYLEDKWRDLKD
jgi:dihydropteroate synthase